MAFELGLKVIVLGDGGNSPPTRPDSISVRKTRSDSWLAQSVRQIITALGWEDEFRCESVSNLADFKAIIEQVNAIDSDFHGFRLPADVPEHTVGFVRRLDVILDLLDGTADALAAEWDLRSESDGSAGIGFEPTIH